MFLLKEDKLFDALKKYFLAVARKISVKKITANFGQEPPKNMMDNFQKRITRCRKDIPSDIDLNNSELLYLKDMLLIEDKILDLEFCLPTQCGFCDNNLTAERFCCGEIEITEDEKSVIIDCKIHGKKDSTMVWLCDNFRKENSGDNTFDRFGRNVVKIERGFQELQQTIDEYLQFAKTQIRIQKVYWLSRHDLSPAQISAIHALHGDQVEIIHRPITFADERGFIDEIRLFYNGFVYAVANAPMYLAAMATGMNFGIFQNHPNRRQDGSFGLAAVYHIEKCQIKKVWLNPDPENDKGELLAPAAR